jgi:hypothetical protein
MPRTVEDLEGYLLALGRNFEHASTSAEAAGSATYLLRGATGATIAVRVAPPIVAINVTIGPRPSDPEHELRLYRRLLELNASDLMHASYGLEDGLVVLSAALALENLDANELELALADIDVALARHVPELAHAARD